MKDFEKITRHEGPGKSPGFALWRLSLAWRTSLEKVLKGYSLTHPQFVVLATLGWLTRKGDKVTQAAVGKLAGLDPNTTSQIVKGLEKKGLISREQGDDLRAKHPALTKKGEGVLAKALPAVETQDARFFKKFTKEQLALLFKGPMSEGE